MEKQIIEPTDKSPAVILDSTIGLIEFNLSVRICIV